MSRKTALEMFKEIKTLEVADSPQMTVEDCLPFMCEKVKEALEVLEIIKNKCVVAHENFELVGKAKNYEQYYHIFRWFDYGAKGLLLEEEYNLLKDWVSKLSIMWV